jgi:hypothetical protein
LVEACFANHDKACFAGRITEGLVEVGIDPWSHRLQGLPHGFAGDGDETFEA